MKIFLKYLQIKLIFQIPLLLEKSILFPIEVYYLHLPLFLKGGITKVNGFGLFFLQKCEIFSTPTLR